jgi:hypothetical protein
MSEEIIFVPQRRSFVRDVWRGDTYSLAVHYWVFLTVPMLFFNLIVAWWNWHSLEMEEWEWAAIPLWLLQIVIWLWGFGGLWNCARHQKWRKMATVAVVFALIGLLRTFGAIAEQLRPADHNVQQEMIMLNSQLPHDYGDATLVRVAYDHHVIEFFYEQDAPVALPGKDYFRKNLCGDIRHYFEKAADSVRFNYKSRDGSSEGTIAITKSDCDDEARR